MKAIDTGLGATFLRAMMMKYPEDKRIYEDPYAEQFLPLFYKFYLAGLGKPKKRDAMVKLGEKKTPGAMGFLICRFAYIDDILKKIVAEKEVKSVVNLGCGQDCRAYKIKGIENMTYFEVDHSRIIKKKMAKIKKIFGSLPEHVKYVPVDFMNQKLDEELQKSGYDPAQKTFFIMEGVTQYISKEANEDTLKLVSKTAVGSKIAFTYVVKDVID